MSRHYLAQRTKIYILNAQVAARRREGREGERGRYPLDIGDVRQLRVCVQRQGRASSKSNHSRDVGSERARDVLKLETRMEGVARGAVGSKSVAERRASVAEDEKDLRKG